MDIAHAVRQTGKIVVSVVKTNRIVIFRVVGFPEKRCLMAIKMYKCECEHAVFPFGKGLPMCIKDFKEERKLKPCIEKGCKFYRKLITAKELIEREDDFE